jgi:hypothetical protein
LGRSTLSGERFDELAKDLAAKTTSRRRFLAGLAGATAAAMFHPARGAALISPGGSDCANQSGSCAAQKCCQGLICLDDQDNAADKFCCPDIAGMLVCGKHCCPTGSVLCLSGQCVCPTNAPDVCPDRTGVNFAGRCTDADTDVLNCGPNCVACPVSTDPCKVEACIGGSCTFVDAPNGTPCTDGNACTRTDTCQNGACVGSDPVVCEALDQCHEVGTCDPDTGLCSNPAKSNGTPCDDGNLCTVNDTCQAGICTPGAPKNCDDNNECTADTCDQATGSCVHTPLPGQPCNQSNKCRTDVCNASGQCQPGPATVTCPQCQVCEPATATCVNVSNGTPCEDGNLCTLGDTCQSGTCQPGAAKTCPSTGNQCTESVCNKTTGVCETRNKPNGTGCDDGNPCTVGDTCQSGTCMPGSLKDCNDNNVCTNDTCNPSTGVCVHMPVPDNTPCGGAMQRCCSGTCTNVSNNKNNCGACGVKCPAMQNCKDGVCS